ncbi:hypothetical protein SYNTR_2175 [Candidatus Syntrophocurvum alkaliphilum]|uniref:CcmD family protein n=2 Tax=Candidatus Syntrophocurvum alkaliphilum TaxID=2293317 RepID=A0A6I6DJJ6_9FIRM|nr:hypothetical protein SYNTR_2175 [Candidatus Syntrophocurvum alkaliphilum]
MLVVHKSVVFLLALVMVAVFPKQALATNETSSFLDTLSQNITNVFDGLYRFMVSEPFLASGIIFFVSFIIILLFLYRKMLSVERLIDEYYSLEQTEENKNSDEEKNGE